MLLQTFPRNHTADGNTSTAPKLIEKMLLPTFQWNHLGWQWEHQQELRAFNLHPIFAIFAIHAWERGGAGSLGLLNVLHMQKHQNWDVRLEFGFYSQWVTITRIKVLPLEDYFTIYLSTFLSSYKGGRSCKRKGIHFRRACSLHQG